VDGASFCAVFSVAVLFSAGGRFDELDGILACGVKERGFLSRGPFSIYLTYCFVVGILIYN
jgi:hypothetical protein